MKTGLINKKSNVKGLGSITMVFSHSSNSEKPGYRGISHLAEHLLCKAWDDIMDTLSSFNIEWNAYTSNDSVVFYWKGLDRKIEELLPHFTKIIGHIPTLEEFENEKRIVLQEYNDTFSDQSCLYTNILRKYTGEFGPIGWRKDIEEMTYEKMVEYIKENYSKPSTLARIGKKFEQKLEYNRKKPKIVKTVPQPNTVEGGSSFENTMILDWVEANEFDKRILDMYIMAFSHGLKSPLTNEIREVKGLSYSCSLYRFGSKQNRLLGFVTTSKKFEEVRTTVNDVISNYKKHITKERYDVICECLRCAIEGEEIENYDNEHMYINEDRIDNEYLENMSYEEFMKHVEIISEKYIKEVKYSTYGEKMIL